MRSSASPLETQTISLYDKIWFTEFGQGTWDPTMVHELSHEWFGNSVSPREWSDLWLNEGHATWYEFLYAEEKGFLEEDTTDYPDPTGYADFDDLMRAVYAHGDQWRADAGPVAWPTSAKTPFSFNVYHGGALVLYALREKIGNRAFERLEREWVRRYRDKSVGTEDFIALASAWRTATCAGSCAPGFTARRPRRCRGTRTGRSIRWRRHRRRRAWQAAHGLLRDDRVLVRVRGGATTEETQRLVVRRPQLVTLARRDHDRVARSDLAFVLAEAHATAPVGEEVDLLGYAVKVLLR